MKYANEINDVQDDALYVEMLEELSRYKTLSHSEIDWEKVYSNSLELLTKSLDTRIFRGFILSVISINNDDVFKKLCEVNHHYKSVWSNVYSLYAEKNSRQAKIQNKFFTDPVNEIIECNNTYKINIPSDIIKDINDVICIFNEELSTNFQLMNIPVKKDDNKKSNEKAAVSYNNVKSIESMDNREYREYFFSLARSLLEKNILNFTAYSLFWEGAWGRVLSEVPHKNNVTEIRYPESNTINVIKNISEYNSENIIRSISNLLLNPFWFEGYKIFIEGALNSNQAEIAYYVKVLACMQLKKFNWISTLYFSNNEAFCSKELYAYFCEDKKQQPEKHAVTNKVSDNKEENLDKKTLKAQLNIINDEVNESVKSRIHGLINLAKVMEVNGFINNASIIYVEVLKLMETTLLKDYLQEEYINIKNNELINK